MKTRTDAGDELMRHIGTKLRQARLERGMAVYDVSACSPSHVSNVERGVAWISVPILFALAHEYSKPVDWFLPGHDTREKAMADISKCKSRVVVA